MIRPLRASLGPALVVLFATAALCAGPARETFGLPDDRLVKIGASVAAARESLQIPGLTVALIRDGARWTRGYGMANPESKTPADSETLYRLASISKPITAVAVLKLAEQGRFDLDADVRRFVPSFPEKKGIVTPRLLMGHLGGIRTYRGDEMRSNRRYENVLAGLAMFQGDPLESEPGTRHLYSTYGYNLLGAAAEAASGSSYLDLVSEHVFKPAGMTRANADHRVFASPKHAKGFRKVDGGVVDCVPADTSNKLPGGGLAATAGDVAAFGEAFLAGHLLSPRSMDLMLTEQKTQEGKGVGYGLGWNLARRDGAREIFHTGGQPGTSTILYLRPGSRLVVVILSNLEGADLKPLARSIAAIVEAPEAD